MPRISAAARAAAAASSEQARTLETPISARASASSSLHQPAWNGIHLPMGSLDARTPASVTSIRATPGTGNFHPGRASVGTSSGLRVAGRSTAGTPARTSGPSASQARPSATPGRVTRTLAATGATPGRASATPGRCACTSTATPSKSGALARRLRVTPPVSPEVARQQQPCPICLEPVGARAWRELACGHCFHEGCILRWVQSAHHPHCPLCRFDLESSALSEFSADLKVFQTEMEAYWSAPQDRGHDILLILVGAEHCRRRLFDAALARFLKLLGTNHGFEDLHVLGQLRDVFNELLHELHTVREVLEERRGGGLVCGCRAQVSAKQHRRSAAMGAGPSASYNNRGSTTTDVELLGLLGAELQAVHHLLQRLSGARVEEEAIGKPRPTAEQPLDAPDGKEICESLRGSLTEVRRICAQYSTASRGAHEKNVNAQAARGMALC